MAATEIVVTGSIHPLPGLLVSVRNAREAIAAVDGGADFIDVKEPENGPLGAASLPTVESIIQAVAGRRPVTVALGELVKGPSAELALPGVAVAKIGLAGSIGIDLAAELSELGRRLPSKTVLAAAAYVDHEQAESPDPEAVLEAISQSDCRWLVFDTYDKSGPSSMSLMPPERLSAWIAGATARGVRVVLAGRIGKDDLATAAACRPWLIGVRGAACVAGRASQIAEDRVRSLAQCLAGCRSNQ